MRTFKQNKPVSCAVLSQKQKWIFAGDEAGIFMVWDIAQEKEKLKFSSPD